jgi:hypothetical protein
MSTMNNNKTAEVKQHAEHTLDNLVISEQFSTSGLSIEHIKIAILESAASKTLKEIARRGIENEMQTLPWQTIEKILYHAAAENKINVDKMRFKSYSSLAGVNTSRARSVRERELD